MAYLPAELIRKKRFGGEHSREELRYLVREFSSGRLPDYQMSAWLMAVCFTGMTPEETAAFTLEMRDSGDVIDLTALGPTVDKHSTGGLGDKTSILLAPLVSAAGIPVPMMAGRGLAHTGGTLDKLESIAGFNVNLSLGRFKAQLAEIGTAIIGQTPEICPADRKLYALRDVTGTVDSLPLICGSIMSKKLAEGMGALILDVKFGSGAFMKTLDQAERLARALIDIGTRAGKKVMALLSRMDEPLGRFVGNALEVRECLDILEGRIGPHGDSSEKDYSDTIALTLALAGHMIHLGGKAKSAGEGRDSAAALLASGAARKKFTELCQHQNADLARGLPAATQMKNLLAESDGFLRYVDAEKVGTACIFLRAGRQFQTDALDPASGIEVLRRNGARVRRNDPLFRLYYNPGCKPDDAETLLRKGFVIDDQPTTPQPLIAKVLA